MARMSLSNEQETPQTHRWTNCLYTVPQCWLTKQQVASIIQYIQLSQSKNMHTKCNFIWAMIQKNVTAMPVYVTYPRLGTNREKGFHKIRGQFHICLYIAMPENVTYLLIYSSPI